MTALHVDERAAEETRPPSRARLRPALGVLVLTLVVGFAAGRFFLLPTPDAGQQTPALADSLAATVAELEQAVADRPTDLAAWQRLGVLYVRRAVEVGDPAFYDLAERAFDRADTLAPDNALTLVGRGSLALSLHRFDEALALGERAVAALPGNADALAVVVDAQVELGRYDAAAATLQQMLDRRPSLPALARASYLRELHGDLDGAIVAMRQAEAAGAASPFDQATVAALLGDLAFEDGHLRAAAAAYTQAAELAEGIVPGAVGSARTRWAAGDIAGAVAVLEPVVSRYPQPAAVVLLGELHAAAGDQRAAGEQFDVARAIADLQRSAGQVVDLEMALFEADHGDAALAVELAEAAHVARPDNVFADDALAWALHRAARSAAAVPHARAAVRLGTADALLHYHAAEVLAAVGDDAGARAQLERALELTPWFSVPYADDALALAARLGVPLPEDRG